jgi:threonine aldolase
VYAERFDTVNVCFSKGLGAPVGSALAGPGETIERARRFRQQFGGGMRQAGVIAAGALHALEHHRDDLRRDVDNARRLALALAVLDGVALDPSRVESNIVRFHVSMDAGDFASACHERGVHMLPNGRHGVRAVLHRDVSDIEVDEAVEVMGSVLAGASWGRCWPGHPSEDLPEWHSSSTITTGPVRSWRGLGCSFSPTRTGTTSCSASRPLG